MKKLILFAFICSYALFSACKNDDDTSVDYDYHAHILSPDPTEKHLGDVLHIEVDFESHTGEAIHHINIRIYNKATKAVVYNEPADAHVFAPGGSYKFETDFTLSAANGFSEHTDWVLEAKVWGEKDGEAEEVSTVEFHVLP